MEKIMQLKTIKEYNDYMGVETRHPLVSVIEGSRMPHPVPHVRGEKRCVSKFGRSENI